MSWEPTLEEMVAFDAECLKTCKAGSARHIEEAMKYGYQHRMDEERALKTAEVNKDPVMSAQPVTEDEARAMWDANKREGRWQYCSDYRRGIEDERKRAVGIAERTYSEGYAKGLARQLEAQQLGSEIIPHRLVVKAKEAGAREERERIVAYMRRGVTHSPQAYADYIEAGAHLAPPPDKRKKAEDRIVERMARAAYEDGGQFSWLEGHSSGRQKYTEEAQAAWLSLPESVRNAAIDEERLRRKAVSE